MAEKLTRDELVKKVAKATGLSFSVADKLARAYEAEIVNALLEYSEVQLHGFGKFTISNLSARPGRNPRTGEPITLPAKRLVHFRGGKMFDVLN